MTENKVTNIINPTASLINRAAEKLSTHDAWDVHKYHGTSVNRLFDAIPEMTLPSVIVSYKGSSFTPETPRRSAEISVITAVEDYGDINTAAIEALPLMDKVMELLDHEICDSVLFRITGDNSIILPEQHIAAYELTFTVEDF
jgi:hypothetical protein